MLDLELEVLANPGILREERFEDRFVQAQRPNIARGANGGRSGRMIEQTHFAEAVAGAQAVQRDLLALIRPLDDPSAPGCQYVERVRRVPFADDQVSEGERHGHEAAGHERPGVRGQQSQNRQLVDQLAFVHAALTSLPPHARGDFLLDNSREEGLLGATTDFRVFFRGHRLRFEQEQVEFVSHGDRAHQVPRTGAQEIGPRSRVDFIEVETRLPDRNVRVAGDRLQGFAVFPEAEGGFAGGRLVAEGELA